MKCTAIINHRLHADLRSDTVRYSVHPEHTVESNETVCDNDARYVYVDRRGNRHYTCREHCAQMLDFLSYVLDVPQMTLEVHV